MQKGTITPNGLGGFDLEMREKSDGVVGFLIKLGIAAATGAAGWIGAKVAAEISETFEKKKAKKEANTSK